MEEKHWFVDSSGQGKKLKFKKERKDLSQEVGLNSAKRRREDVDCVEIMNFPRREAVVWCSASQGRHLHWIALCTRVDAGPSLGPVCCCSCCDGTHRGARSRIYSMEDTKTLLRDQLVQDRDPRLTHLLPWAPATVTGVWALDAYCEMSRSYCAPKVLFLYFNLPRQIWKEQKWYLFTINAYLWANRLFGCIWFEPACLHRASSGRCSFNTPTVWSIEWVLLNAVVILNIPGLKVI